MPIFGVGVGMRGGRGVRGWRVLKPKAYSCVYVMAWKILISACIQGRGSKAAENLVGKCSCFKYLVQRIWP